MFEDKELDELMAKENESPQPVETVVVEEKASEGLEEVSENTLPATQQDKNSTAIIENSTYSNDFKSAVGDTQRKIIEKAKEKINDEKMIEKHSESIAKITDRALEVEAEQQRLVVEKVNADNKVVAQEIKNKLIVLKAEAKRLKKEQKQATKDQKAKHKKRNKDAKWELYKDKLTKMKYDYVPNEFILRMLLFFDGIVSFFNGLGAVSTAIVKALKWVIVIALILIVLMSVPVTREWFLALLKFK